MTGCREACSEAGEPLAGTAGTSPVFVGVRWPKPLWHPEKAELSAGLPQALIELLARESARREKLALRLFQQAPGAASEVTELWFVDRDDAFRVQGVPVGELSDALATALAGGRPLGAESLEPSILVCTDGQHDRCCAARGRPMFQALRQAADPHGIPVLESSHLGGHRFAPTCLVLPARELYGRLSPEDAPELVQAIREGRPLTRALRGRLGQSEVEQVARIALQSSESPLAEARVADVEGDEQFARVRFAEGDSQVVVRLERRTYSVPTSCGDTAAEPRPRWLVVA